MSNPFKFEPLNGAGVSPPKPGTISSSPPSKFVQSAVTNKPLDFRMTDTTRHLSAAVYSKKNLRDLVFQNVIEEKHKAIVASYGVDLVTVAGHCLLARRKKIVRDALIFTLTLLFLLQFIFEVPLLALVSMLAIWGIVIFDSYTTKYSIIGSRFNKTTFDPTSIQTKLSQEDQAKLTEIAALQKGNVIIYGGFSPFVGSGFNLGGWSFTIKLNKGKEEHGKRLIPLSVQPEELHQVLTQMIVDLGLEGVSVEDKLYVDGQDIRNDHTFLPHPFSRPNTTVDAATMSGFIAHSTSFARHYKCIQVISWKAELILSIFVRFTRIKSNLFAEASYFLLPPLEESFHEADNLHPTPTLNQVLELFAISTLKTPFMLPYSTLMTLSTIVGPFTDWRAKVETRKSIKENPMFNYGAVSSIRESATSKSFSRYFQKLDKEMHVKLIERQILDCITDFLDSKNIDTSDLKERQQNILNNGVIVYGGSVQAQSLAVGKQAVAQAGSKIASAIGFSPLNIPTKSGQSQPQE